MLLSKISIGHVDGSRAIAIDLQSAKKLRSAGQSERAQYPENWSCWKPMG
jgi:hypothetical protein